MKRLTASALHPTSWWVLGIAIAIAGSLTLNPWVLLTLIAISLSVVLFFREAAPWSRSLKFYLFTASLILITRLLFRIIFNFDSLGGNVIFYLPEVKIPFGIDGQITFLGALTDTALYGALTEGLRLATIVMAIGLANTLSNPRKLLKSTPPALFEIASAVSVAVNLAPQLIASLQRVRQARNLRGKSKKLSALAGIVIPVLEDTLDKSLALAASMDSRGFGRSGNLSAREQLGARATSLLAILFAVFSAFFLLSGLAPAAVAIALFGAAIILSFAVLRITSRRSNRTRLVTQQRTWLDLVAYGFGIALITLAGFSGWLA